MAASSHAQHYLREAVLTATQEQLQLMLYDGAIRFTMQGRDALTKKDFERVFEHLSRAQNIVMEMYNGLNHKVNPELCERVGALYMFIYHKLVDGSARHDVQALDDALKILRMERETWQILVDKVASERGEANAAFGSAAHEPGSLSVEV
ncbi:MAG: flagellar export chaperone FliS [Phycisphaerales bacterium]|nr:flagellar export chaperone FliS [Phycisphaerales bacterium]